MNSKWKDIATGIILIQESEWMKKLKNLLYVGGSSVQKLLPETPINIFQLTTSDIKQQICSM